MNDPKNGTDLQKLQDLAKKHQELEQTLTHQYELWEKLAST
jgi:hypothetical protein